MSNEQQQNSQSPPSPQVVYYQPHPYDPEDEIDLRDLFATIWQGKWLIAAFIIVGSTLAAGYAFLQPNTYKSETLLAPAESDQQGAVSRLAQQYGGLANMAGIDLGESGTTRTQIALAILESRAFLINFINRHDLLVPLLAAKGWDHTKQEWIIDRSIYDVHSGKWVRDVEFPTSGKPTDLQAYQALKKRLSVSQEKDTGLVTVSLELMSPVAAQDWLAKLIDDLNDRMRQRDISETKRTITYLNEQIKTTSIADMRQVFFQLIERQTQRQMLAKVRDQYALRIVDPPVVPEKKVAPNRSFIIVLGFCVSGMLALIVIFFRSLYKDSTEE